MTAPGAVWAWTVSTALTLEAALARRPASAGGRQGWTAEQREGCHCDQLGADGGSHRPSSGVRTSGTAITAPDRKLDRHPDQPGAPAIPVMLLLLAAGVLAHHRRGRMCPPSWLSDRPVLGAGTAEPSCFADAARPGLAPRAAGDWACYRVLAWVVSVMLPPMAIFFPLFTLLEDVGYLPRVAFNLDQPFQKCCACGKQALTMCMGFGCNAAGVVGCRIIDSPRERLHRHPDQQLRPLQRPLPHPDRHADHVLCRHGRRAVRLAPVGSAADPAHPAGAWA